ncbi:hypothetical protein SVI_0897 [Shewanella violacea DSS12]|uniref:Uncharacterized protein n=1 Tax=Shewanella violacea (strain JCM 10179 / CIP 106290 / LMG 19151 / DSS12) TaxID=637905 RepID=D4ZGR9_SHEVD|nr:hypothetical protein SVI_0897 [Shewanella violacea DSS12]
MPVCVFMVLFIILEWLKLEAKSQIKTPGNVSEKYL